MSRRFFVFLTQSSVATAGPSIQPEQCTSTLPTTLTRQLLPPIRLYDRDRRGALEPTIPPRTVLLKATHGFPRDLAAYDWPPSSPSASRTDITNAQEHRMLQGQRCMAHVGVDVCRVLFLPSLAAIKRRRGGQRVAQSTSSYPYRSAPRRVHDGRHPLCSPRFVRRCQCVWA